MKQQLGDGLVMRTLSAGYAGDAAQLPDFYVRVFGEDGSDPHPELLGEWTHDLIGGGHPTLTLDDVWCVVDTANGDKVVSALLLIPQTWRYGDVAFGLGRVELVATDAAYRHKGLVRRMFNALHERSAALGHLAQGITGIPHYYRRFGYGMSLPLGSRWEIAFAHVPEAKADATPRFSLRPATDDDAPRIAEWDAAGAQRGLLSVARTADDWRYEIGGKREGSIVRWDVLVIQQNTPTPRDVGFVVARRMGGSRTVQVYQYTVSDDSSYLATFDDVLRGLVTHGRDMTGDDDKPAELISFSGDLPEATDLLARKTGGRLIHPLYAWYMRVPDIGAFLRHVAPVLERRLVGSAAHRFDGEIRLSFYNRSGLLMRFADGRLKAAQTIQIGEERVNGALAYDMLLNLVFGMHSLSEIQAILPECWLDKTAHAILDAIFPKGRSLVYPCG